MGLTAILALIAAGIASAVKIIKTVKNKSTDKQETKDKPVDKVG